MQDTLARRVLTILVHYEYRHVSSDRIVVRPDGTRFYLRTFEEQEWASLLIDDTRFVVDIIPVS